MFIRELEEKDNKQIEMIIRTCLKEFGGDREGLAWADPLLGRLSEIYGGDQGVQGCPSNQESPDGQKDQVYPSKYWVVESNGEIVGGCGIGPIEQVAGVCELQKMYCLPDTRGTGIAHQLMKTALAYASEHYNQCYIETLSNMEAANRFYQKYNFISLDKPLGDTGHYSCDVWYLKELKPDH